MTATRSTSFAAAEPGGPPAVGRGPDAAPLTRRAASGPRRPRRSRAPAALALAGLCLLGLRALPSDGDRIALFVSILPQAYLAERVGCPYVQVDALVPPGQSPATYEPTPGQMVGLNRAKVFFSIGVPFERGFLGKISSILPDLPVVDTRAGIELRPMDDGHRHEAGPEAGGSDPHVWLDPRRAKLLAAAMCDHLARIDPGREAHYRRNLRMLHDDLDALDARIEQLLAPFAGRAIYVFHPSYGYFAERYGLRQVAVETAGKEPGPRHLAAIIRQAKDDGVSVVFVQPQFTHASAKTIGREIGGEVVTLDPLAWDYLRNLEDMAGKVKQALSR